MIVYFWKLMLSILLLVPISVYTQLQNTVVTDSFLEKFSAIYPKSSTLNSHGSNLSYELTLKSNGPTLIFDEPKCLNVKQTNCVMSNMTQVSINSALSCLFNCSYNLQEKLGPVRLEVRVTSSIKNISVFVSARQRYIISSWTLPITFSKHEGDQIYNTINEVLCPPFNVKDAVHFRIDTSSVNDVTIQFGLTRPELNLQLNTPVLITSSPVSPWIRFYQWQDGEESVLISAKSSGKIGRDVCAYLSIQNAKCPVGTRKADIVSGEGRYQSFQEQGGMVARKVLFPDGIFIVILPLPNDAMCTGIEAAMNKTSRGKTVELEVLAHSTISSKLTYFFIVGGMVAAVAIGSAVIFISCIKSNLTARNVNSSDEEALVSNMDDSFVNPSVIRTFSAGVIIQGRASDERSPDGIHVSTSEEPNSVNDEGETPNRALPRTAGIRERLLAITGGDSNPFEDSRGDIGLREAETAMNEVAEQDGRIPSEVTKVTQDNNPRFMYWWKVYTEHRNKDPDANISEVGFKGNLLIVAVFMALPLSDILRAYIQVFSYQGTEDQCFYNSLCITSFWIFPDFSRVFTNIGYLLCGICFYSIVKVHQHHNMKFSAGQTLGVSRNYGLFQSLAFGLFIQGVMSALYHVCPNQVTLRFDMMFMYVDAIILIVGIWGLRHGGVAHHVYPTVGLLGAALLAAEAREWISDGLFWSLVVISHLIFTVTIGAMICYLGTWSFSPVSMFGIWKDWRPITQNLNSILREDTLNNKKHWTIIRTLLGLIANGALMVAGPLADMEVYLYILLVCIVNMVMYVINYITTKVFLCKEKGTKVGWICILLSGIFWIVALVFFTLHNTNTEVSPAFSREMNSNCILFNVFDTHDLWHLMSSLAMYFSFVGVLTMDDDLVRRNPKKIPVF